MNIFETADVYLSNMAEDISHYHWNLYKRKIECCICGDELISDGKDSPSPMQCGWKRIDPHRWICHRCLDHRVYAPYAELTDLDERINAQYNKYNKGLIDPEEDEIIKEKIEILTKMIEDTKKGIVEDDK